MRKMLMGAALGAVIAVGALPAAAAIAPTQVKVESFEKVGSAPPLKIAGGTNYATTSYTLTVLPPAPVPVPAALPLLATALVGLGIVRRRAKKAA